MQLGHCSVGHLIRVGTTSAQPRIHKVVTRYRVQDLGVCVLFGRRVLPNIVKILVLAHMQQLHMKTSSYKKGPPTLRKPPILRKTNLVGRETDRGPYARSGLTFGFQSSGKLPGREAHNTSLVIQDIHDIQNQLALGFFGGALVRNLYFDCHKY